MTEDTATQTSNSEGRFSLADDGQIFLQPDKTNPLPGNAVGKIVKGDALLAPKTDAPSASDWIAIHVRQVLEPLFILKGEGEGALTGAAKEMGERLFDHLGVMHRSDLEDLIAQLDPDSRKALRSKGVRLGPILVFLPALVKPAAVRMRALLWGVWNDKPLPVVRPADGRVSEVVDPATIDRHFYRMIGYPVFGPRAIRIDMLDRVVTDVYDTAQQGVFEARHKYAEWLGCNLEDLHAVLESMGHRKLKAEGEPKKDPTPATPPATEPSPQESPVREPNKEAPVQNPPENPVPQGPTEVPPDAPGESPIPSGPVEVPQVDPTPMGAAKAAPVVVKFMLKRGKMSDRPQSRRPHKPEQRAAKPVALAEPERKREDFKRDDKVKFDPNKPSFRKDREKPKDRDAKGKDERPRKKFDKDDRKDGPGRVYTFDAKKPDGDDDNNPFAILKKLKS